MPICEDSSDVRRKKYAQALPAVNSVREQLVLLKRLPKGANPAGNYVAKLHSALMAIMKDSFEEEYRKVVTDLGILDSIAEILILDISYYGLDCSHENRSLRKLIASSLTNLTFGNSQSKRRLCTFPDFIKCAISVIEGSPCLAQVYAGLLRNLSWMADAEMSATLLSCVPVLARASLRAYHTGEAKCLCALLSALWNLASHSKENKKSICEEIGFIDMLVELLAVDSQFTALIEAASGVLKYASMYLAAVGSENFLTQTVIHKLLYRLIELLNSSSFTVIGNSLGVLAQLLAKNHQLRAHLRVNSKAVQYLTHLRNSARDDIRNPVKTVLGYLNFVDSESGQSSGYYTTRVPRISNHTTHVMSSSYNGYATVSSQSDSTRRVKSNKTHNYIQMVDSNMSKDDNSNNRPYMGIWHGSRQGFAPRPGDIKMSNYSTLPHYPLHYERASQAGPIEQVDVSNNPTTGSEIYAEEDISLSQQSCSVKNSEIEKCEDVSAEMDDINYEIEDSLRCTRCTSIQSLSSLLVGQKSTWESFNNSIVNSNRLSPASATELPDSPTQCITQTLKNVLLSTDSDQIDINKDPSFCENKSPKQVSKHSPIISNSKLIDIPASDDIPGRNKTEQNFIEDVDTYLSNTKIQSNSETTDRNSGDYSSFLGTDTELLNQSIEGAMPKRCVANDDFLAQMIEKAQPKPHYSPRNRVNNLLRSRPSQTQSKNITSEENDFLLQSIASVLPQSTSNPNSFPASDSSAKKERAKVCATDHLPNGPKIMLSVSHKDYSSLAQVPWSSDVRNDSSLPSASKRSNVENGFTLSNNDNYSPSEGDFENFDAVIPLDVDEELKAEHVLIDCKAVNIDSQKNAVKEQRNKQPSRIPTNKSKSIILTKALPHNPHRSVRNAFYEEKRSGSNLRLKNDGSDGQSLRLAKSKNTLSDLKTTRTSKRSFSANYFEQKKSPSYQSDKGKVQKKDVTDENDSKKSIIIDSKAAAVDALVNCSGSVRSHVIPQATAQNDQNVPNEDVNNAAKHVNIGASSVSNKIKTVGKTQMLVSIV